MSYYLKIVKYEKFGEIRATRFILNLTIYGLDENTVIKRIIKTFRKNLNQDKIKDYERRTLHKIQ
jgi:hypothetical protein